MADSNLQPLPAGRWTSFGDATVDPESSGYYNIDTGQTIRGSEALQYAPPTGTNNWTQVQGGFVQTGSPEHQQAVQDYQDSQSLWGDVGPGIMNSLAFVGGVYGATSLAGAFGGEALSGVVGGAEGGAAGWTSGYDLAGGGALEGWGAGTTGAGGWTSGYDLPMGDGGVTTSGAEFDPFANVADGAPGSTTYTGAPLDPLITTPGWTGAAGAASTLSKLGSTLGTPGSTSSLGDWAKLLGPLASIGSGLYGMGLASDLGEGVSADTSGALAGLQGLGINIGGVGTSTTGGTPGTSLDTDAKTQAAIAGADPWGTSGGRALADAQLQALMRDPSQVAASDPAYALRIQAAQRAMGGYGQDSGAMAVAGANASTDWLNQRQLALASLENMGNPVGAQQVGLGVGQLGVQQGQLGVQQGQLGLDTERTKANLELSKAGLGLDAAKLKLAGQMGANSLAGQSLASLGYGATQLTGGNTTIPPEVLRYLQQMGSRV